MLGEEVWWGSTGVILSDEDPLLARTDAPAAAAR